MWNISEIKKKQKYVLERLKNNVSNEEKERLELSLISFISLLNNSGTLYTKFYNLMDRITKDRFSLQRNSPYIEIERKLVYDQIPNFDNNYLQFLLNLTTNVASNVSEEQIEFLHLNMSDDDLIRISSSFYSQLGDQEIIHSASKVLNDSSAINITSTTRDGYQEFGGITFNDFIFNKSYCTMTKNSNIFDIQVLNHEVMHGIDFYMHPKLPSTNYFGFHEVPTYTIDYLLIDYLEQMGFDSNEVEKLRIQKSSYLANLANLTLTQIKGQLIRKKGLKSSVNPALDDINEVLTPQIKKQLLEIQSGIIAFGLSQQMNYDKELGINNLKQFMKNDIPKQQTPDFSFIGLSNETLLQLSQQMSVDKSNYMGKSK